MWKQVSIVDVFTTSKKTPTYQASTSMTLIKPSWKEMFVIDNYLYAMDIDYKYNWSKKTFHQQQIKKKHGTHPDCSRNETENL
jgi:hypothetical protein